MEAFGVGKCNRDINSIINTVQILMIQYNLSYRPLIYNNMVYEPIIEYNTVYMPIVQCIKVWRPRVW